VQSELQRMRQEYDRRKGEIEKEHEKLALIKAEIESSNSSLEQADSSKLKSLELDLRRKESLIAKKDAESARLQKEIAKFKSEKTQASDSHSVELNNLSNELKSLEALLENHRQQASGLKNEIKELEKVKNQAVKSRERTIRRLKEALLTRERKLAKQREETKKLNQEIARLEAKDKEYRNQLSQVKENLTKLDGPTIYIIEPRVVKARGLRIVAVKPGTQNSRIIGKVQASTGIYSCTVNQKEVELDPDGLFRVSIPLQRSKDTPVEIVAVDKKGKRADFTFLIPLKSVSATPQFASLNFGRYHALVIGNNDYQNLPKLESAVNDANKFSKILAEKYNFKTKVLINATRYDILKELDEFRRNLRNNDNFLLYYAGHGELDRKNKRGYWLPIDAEPESNVNSIPNYAVTDILNTMEVKQAIIIADTCYSGILTRSAINRNRDNSELDDEKRYNWLKKLIENRSRTVLTSGGLKPVLDSGSGEHSVFAKALIDVLEPNQKILEASQLHSKIGALVSYSSSELGLEQVPQYAANLHAGHVGGDFLFVPAVFQ
jgi:CII-binding regulator of phage lambda lysogenization HflD